MFCVRRFGYGSNWQRSQAGSTVDVTDRFVEQKQQLYRGATPLQPIKLELRTYVHHRQMRHSLDLGLLLLVDDYNSPGHGW